MTSQPEIYIQPQINRTISIAQFILIIRWGGNYYHGLRLHSTGFIAPGAREDGRGALLPTGLV